MFCLVMNITGCGLQMDDPGKKERIRELYSLQMASEILNQIKNEYIDVVNIHAAKISFYDSQGNTNFILQTRSSSDNHNQIFDQS